MKTVLIICHLPIYPYRVAIDDHLYSFKRHGDCNCFYVNVAARSIPNYILKLPIDTIIFHTTFLSTRWTPWLFDSMMDKVACLEKHPAEKVAFPQDEFIHTTHLATFINRFDIKRVYSLFKASEWPKIYPGVDLSKVDFQQVMPGYLEDAFAKKIEGFVDSKKPRPIAIGYRAWHAAAWLGRHGQKKHLVASVVRERAEAIGVPVDISTEEKDTILGWDWFRFLAKSRTVIGVEGGASILDKDGAIKKATEAFVADHPNASFEEIEAACFPGIDGKFDGVAISPRHLECCLTRTCQVLMEGEYNGVLKAGEHYIELKSDYSNLDEVLNLVKDEKLCSIIAERAYKHVVESGAYNYRSFVREILNSFPEPQKRAPFWLPIALRWNRLVDACDRYRQWGPWQSYRDLWILRWRRVKRMLGALKVRKDAKNYG